MFNAAVEGVGKGDPYIDSQIEKAKLEFDLENRKAIVKETQRYLGSKQYSVTHQGNAALFTMAWPIVQNFRVFQGGSLQAPTYWWLDGTKPPLRQA